MIKQIFTIANPPSSLTLLVLLALNLCSFAMESERAEEYCCLSKKQLKDRAKINDIRAQYELALLYKSESDKLNNKLEEAKGWLEIASSYGNIEATIELAKMYLYFEDRGIPKDGERALKYLKKALKEDNAEAQCLIGDIFNEGLGNVPQNKDEALQWYLFAAELGSNSAKTNIGEMYIHGYAGLKQDFTKALEWYLPAAEAGDARAQEHTGHVFVQLDKYKEAFRWTSEAAEKGREQAQYNLAMLYQHGIGVKKNRKMAKFWLEEASEQGHLKAKEQLAKLGNRTFFQRLLWL